LLAEEIIDAEIERYVLARLMVDFGVDDEVIIERA
jgi:hypothetical protein